MRKFLTAVLTLGILLQSSLVFAQQNPIDFPKPVCMPSEKIYKNLLQTKLQPSLRAAMDDSHQLTIWSDGKSWVATMNQAPKTDGEKVILPAMSCIIGVGKEIEFRLPPCTASQHGCY